jgi:hypothetical protein
LCLCWIGHHNVETSADAEVQLHIYIFSLGARCRQIVSFTIRPVYHRGNSPRYSQDSSLALPQSRSGRYGEEMNLLPCLELNPVSSVVEPVA